MLFAFPRMQRPTVFFADEATALAAGYRPCASCMREEYRAWVEESLRAGKDDLP